jgi:hypothetical protein
VRVVTLFDKGGRVSGSHQKRWHEVIAVIRGYLKLFEVIPYLSF